MRCSSVVERNRLHRASVRGLRTGKDAPRGVRRCTRRRSASSLRQGFCFTAREIDIPSMQRASRAVAVHHSLQERGTLMWTMIEQREARVLSNAKDRDITGFPFDHAAARGRIAETSQMRVHDLGERHVDVGAVPAPCAALQRFSIALILHARMHLCLFCNRRTLGCLNVVNAWSRANDCSHI